ncbi:MAG TPA: glycosyl transferase family 1 [Geobacter sp.]|nr:glycosyl transferase family 1 [Geobacter sp.]
MQRVAAIDHCFSAVERAYLKISFVGNFPGKKERRGERLTIYRLNFFLHFFGILRLALGTDCIYLHSVGNALAMLPFYFFRKMVTDMHGAVPEEFTLAGKRLAALRYAPVEWVAVRYSRAVVTVSRAMAEHLRDKYSLSRLPSFNVPIFDEVTVPRSSDDRVAAVPRVIYAGGAQVWQNVDLMLEAIGKAKTRCAYTILTGDVGTFRDKVAALGLAEITISSVPKDEVYGYYARADYGFVLRDDTLVNRVACPTKLVEYLSCGVIPIVIQPRIGDFAEYGYSYLTLERFVKGELPTPAELEEMRANNYKVIAAMKGSALTDMERLVAFCRGGELQVAHGA